MQMHFWISEKFNHRTSLASRISPHPEPDILLETGIIFKVANAEDDSNLYLFSQSVPPRQVWISTGGIFHNGLLAGNLET